MPTVEGLTTKSAEQVWRSPDGSRTIYQVTLDYKGKDLVAKTYSEAIATVGWSGDVVTDERPNKRGGTDTFVKSAPKEGYSGGGGFKGGSKPLSDPFTMFLSYAKDAAIASVHEGKFNGTLYAELLDAISAGGAQLYASRPGGEPAEAVSNSPSKPEPVTLDDVFGGTKEEGDTPWTNR